MFKKGDIIEVIEKCGRIQVGQRYEVLERPESEPYIRLMVNGKQVAVCQCPEKWKLALEIITLEN